MRKSEVFGVVERVHSKTWYMGERRRFRKYKKSSS